MKINKIAFGDTEEAFVENRLQSGLNVIFSDDNNRGKTLVMQGLMFSLGYESIFPSSFNYKDKYFYSEIEVGGVTYEFLRKRNSIAIKSEDAMQIFNSVGEARYFLDKFVFSVPKVLKDGRNTLVDLSLLYELFFIGQDDRNPSGLISKGQFNKSDYKSMIYYLAGLSGVNLNNEDIKAVKDKISNLKLKLKELVKKISIIRQNPNIAEIASKTYDSEAVQEKIKKISYLNENISKLKRSRQREINRKSKLEQLVSELVSLNRELNEGNVKCGECGSDKIIYSNVDLTFEISNIDVRNGILNSIDQNIKQKIEIIMDYSKDINSLQGSLNDEMKDTPPNFQQVILYQEQVLSERNYDEDSFALINQIKVLEEQLRSHEKVDESLKEERKRFDDKILFAMNGLYKSIDPGGNLVFEDIFTKKGSTFSGSEGQEFYFCKVVALKKMLKHDFPLIIDSFRDGELSTKKEEKMLNIYKGIDSQIILTSTLKAEEYSSDKYSRIEGANALDYSKHQDCKILSQYQKAEFLELISNFDGIVL
ncbi:hypothetical protein CXF94_12090 [Halomonas sp. Choline-3u-9]|uniref:hypothetical protein n=1 Tax=unclassified Halomonas TaxID=2609666 RepID=UPI0004858A36|nr:MULTISPECIES: hypothetical protein [unclassified Halomonas]NAO97975.1 hypothetical protein [Halomonas sp. MG34]PKH61043.1 hypothetical protein CXF94_12090 [Halomonas sp. Choline-3u-9]